MTPTAISKASLKIREEILSLRDDLQKIKKEANTKLVQLSNLVHKVQKEQLWKDWINPQTKKAFTSFELWIKVDTGESKASVYRFLGVKEHLDLPDKTLEMIGTSRSFELVRVAKEQPKLLPKFVKAIEKNPDLPLYTLQNMVTNALASGHYDSGEYERFDYAIKIEDAPDIRKAFAIMQAMEPVDDPDSAAGRGVHLLDLCQDLLSRKDARAILKKLEDAGAFNGNTKFKLEE